MKIIFQLLAYNLISFVALAQFNVTLKTPKGTNVDALDYIYLYGEDYDQPEWEYQDNYWLTVSMVDSSQVTLLAHSSLAYNCHSYAWNVSEGGGTLWINDLDAYLNDIDNVNRYWDDGSYVETTEANHRKVFYHPETVFDHSAVTTEQSGWFISKWTNGPLVRHEYDNCPYWNSAVDLTYYKLNAPFISGSITGALCNNVQRTFSETAFTDIDLEYDWDCTSPLDEVSNDDDPTYSVKGTAQNGQGTISLTVTTPSGATAIGYKNVWVGKPQIYAYGNHIVDVNTGMPVYNLCYGTHNDVEAVHPAGDAGITDWDWQVLYGQVYPYGMQDQYATIYPNDYQSFMLEIRACNRCDCSGWAHMYTNVVDCGRFLLVFTPNPTSGETTLSIESESEEKTFDENAEWEMEIYNQSQLLKEKKTKLKGKSIKIQTQSWKEGVYFVRVKYKNEVMGGKLVVK
ncbi:MAG: T9SS type A sorting domain-containing protein [Draconibacterium sp.]